MTVPPIDAGAATGVRREVRVGGWVNLMTGDALYVESACGRGVGE